MSTLKVNKIIPTAGVPTGGGGGIIQVITSTTQNSTGSVSVDNQKNYANIPDQLVTITPTSSTSKILVSFHQSGETSASSHMFGLALERSVSGGSTTLIQGDIGSDSSKSAQLTQLTTTYYGNDNDTTMEIGHCSNYLDSPNTTSAVTYKVKIRQNEAASGTYYYNRNVRDNNATHSERGLSWITVMEVSA
tara:strand:+ start:235 stop:807 length:573 start_codon:yes stop_codon:yes gene_type:complete